MSIADQNLLIGIDLGGTEIKSILTNPSGQIFDQKNAKTLDIPGKDNSPHWKTAIRNMVDEYCRKYDTQIRGIGISSPGTVNNDYSHVLSNGNKLLGIEGYSWTESIGRRVFVLNDAHAALMAEAKLGAARDYQNVAMFTLGTGVGGAIMIDGDLVRGWAGRAGHFGHISVTRDVRVGIVGTPGSLESEVGECSLFQRSFGRYKKTFDLLSDVQNQDPFATWVWLQSIQALARGIVTIQNAISPDCIVIGGGVSNAGDELIRPLTSFLEVFEWRPEGKTIPVVLAELKNNAGSLGAALFAHERTLRL